MRPISWQDWTENERMSCLSDRAIDRSGGCVIYWVQNAMRGTDNEALNAAVALADELSVGVVAYVALHTRIPHATARSYTFLLQGLRDLAGELKYRGIPLVVRNEDPRMGLPVLTQETRCAAVVTDRSALRLGRLLRHDVARSIDVGCFEVDSEHIVPLHIIGRAHQAARTIRPVIHNQLDSWLWTRHDPRPRVQADAPSGIDVRRPIHELLSSLNVDMTVPAVSETVGGSVNAQRLLSRFVVRSPSSRPVRSDHTRLSAYLRFGHISSASVVRALRCGASERDLTIIEQVLVRRELAANFAWYTLEYATSRAIPGWARETLQLHASERVGNRYTREQLAAALTDDPLWNAAQRELLSTGRIESYVRMYWGKRLVEWFEDVDLGLKTALWLNDRFALDGRSPNGISGVLWCYGLHDRPFLERPCIGLVRPLGVAGVKRNINLDEYLRWTSGLMSAA